MARKKRDSKQKGIAEGVEGAGGVTALERQVRDGDTVTIEDWKQFVTDAKKYQEDYRDIATRSWREIERRNNTGGIYGDQEPVGNRFRRRFPLWWSCWKIRQPITLARLAVPVLKDTQGDDPYGRTACIIGERFIKGILKTFEAFPEFSAGNDDFLVTNFGWGRWCYRSEEIQEEEKIRLQVQEQEPPPPPEPELGPDGQPLPDQEPPMPPEPLPPLFFTPDGEEVPGNMVREDDLGPYLSTGEMVSVDNEELYFEAGDYAALLVEPTAKRWSKVTRCAFEYSYGYREFKEKFGTRALDTLRQKDLEEYKSGRESIKVYECYDSILKEVRWFSENSEDFFQPKEMYPEREEERLDNGDLYGVSGFFPCTEPLLINQSTRSFWPTPEYYQVQEVLDQISSIYTRMIQLTKAVRIRFLYDSSVTALGALIGENWAEGEGTGIGVVNLQDALMNANGDLSKLVAWFPVDELMKGLQSMYGAFEQQINLFYNITGFSDLLRGQVSNTAANDTYRGLQLEGKYAMNRVEPFQRKIQEWIKDNYQLAMEMGLKLFSDETIDEYITPQTLDREDKERYVAALDLLRSNRRGRFRMDFETDSTISINEEWKKKQAIDTANAITKMMESTAKTAQDMPELATAELKVMMHVVGELTDGKLFADEIEEAIQQTIDKVNQPKEPEPNIELEKLKMEGQKLAEEFKLKTRQQEFEEAKAMTNDRLEQLTIQMKGEIESAKLAQKDRVESVATQLEQFKLDVMAGQESAKLNVTAQKIQSEIAIAQQELAVAREELMIQAQDIASKAELKQMEMILDQRIAEQEQKLKEVYVSIDTQLAASSEREKWATEERLQAEHEMGQVKDVVDIGKTINEIENLPTIDVKDKK